MTGRIVRTTRGRAATLARIIEAGESGRPLTPAEIGYWPSILVETTASIPGNSTARHTVRIVENSGGVPAASRSTMLVRHCGANTIASGVRLMAEYCGQLGYVIQRGSGTPKFSPTIQRYFRADGPLATESQGETVDWQFQAFSQSAPTTYQGLSGWVLPIDFSVSPTTVNYRSRWTSKGYPFRFKIEGWGESYQGGQSRLSAPRQGLDSQPYDFARQTNFDAPLNVRFPLSDLTPPAACHLDNFRCNGAHMLRFSTFTSLTETTPWPYEIGIRRELFYQGNYYTPQVTVAFRKARVLIDGVDQSGIVNPSFLTFSDNGTSVQLWGAATTSQQTPAQKSVWLDVWIDVAVSIESWAAGALTGTQQALILPPYVARCQGVIGAMDWFETTGTTRKWTLAFDANGPAGVTSLTTYETNGSMVASTTQMTWEGTGTPTNRVQFVTDQEVCYITVRKAGPHASPTAGMAVYLAEPSGDYEPLRFASGGTMEAGCWDTDAATTFRRVGGTVSSMILGPVTSWLDLHGAGDPTSYDALYDTFPSTITVSPA